MSTHSKKFHEKFIKWALDNGAYCFKRGHNVNEKDTYVNEKTQLAWLLWQEVYDDSLIIKKANEYKLALERIVALNPADDSDEGYNEWGEADCFNKSQEIARKVLDNM
jgi:hypothetical protein